MRLKKTSQTRNYLISIPLLFILLSCAFQLLGNSSPTWAINDTAISKTGSTIPTITSQISIRLNMIPPTSANVRYTGDLGEFLLDYHGPEASDRDAITDHATFIVEKGVYTVTELARPQWYVQSIACDTPSATLLEDGISVMIDTTAIDQAECIFTTYHKSTIGALIFHDLNGNHLRSLGEPYLPSTSVQLYDQQLNLIASDATTATGRVSYKALQQGSYTLCEEIPAGFNNSRPNILHPILHQPCYTINVQPGRSVTGVFGNTNPAKIQPDTGVDEFTLIDLSIKELYFLLDNGQYQLVEVESVDWSLWTDEHQIYLPVIDR